MTVKHEEIMTGAYSWYRYPAKSPVPEDDMNASRIALRHELMKVRALLPENARKYDNVDTRAHAVRVMSTSPHFCSGECACSGKCERMAESVMKQLEAAGLTVIRTEAK